MTFIVEGLTDNTVDTILGIDPEFINYSKLNVGLTAGRHNGLLQMLKHAQRQALALKQNL
jgi:sulfur transfer protein SufE